MCPAPRLILRPRPAPRLLNEGAGCLAGRGRDNGLGAEGGTEVGRGMGSLTLLQKLYLGCVA